MKATASLLLLATLLVSMTAPTRLAAQELRVATVNLRTLFEGYYKTKAADANIKERAAEFGKEKEALVNQFKALGESYKQARDDANNQAISAAEREKRKKAAEAKLVEVREMEQTITQFDRQAMATLDEQERRMRSKILEEIQAVIDTQGKGGNYNFVIDTAAESLNRTPVILFSNGVTDLTEDILKTLNANAPEERLSTQP